MINTKMTLESVVASQESAYLSQYDAENKCGFYDPENWDSDDMENYEKSRQEEIQEHAETLKPITCDKVQLPPTILVRLDQEHINSMFPILKDKQNIYNRWIVVGEISQMPGHVVITNVMGINKKHDINPTMIIHDDCIEIIPPQDL